ncbi:hypothetical protein NSQ76_01010 [Bacillus sp. FSL M8-0256]|uniref:hypothetical protein n=1 Tax=Bacillus sp. FSL M8-0256 TaxID=2954578 RepID=UPI0030FBE5E9
MRILVLKTNCLLDQGTKENIREEAKKAAQTGIMILDRGMGLDVIEVDKSALLDEKGIAESFEQAMKKVREMTVGGKYVPYEERKAEKLEASPLIQITLKDIHSVPEVIHKGEPLEGRVDIDFNWKTGGFDTVGSTYINLRTLGSKGKKPSEKRIEYKHGEAMDELPTKDDLVWDKERGVYILPKKKQD